MSILLFTFPKIRRSSLWEQLCQIMSINRPKVLLLNTQADLSFQNRRQIKVLYRLLSLWLNLVIFIKWIRETVQQKLDFIVKAKYRIKIKTQQYTSMISKVIWGLEDLVESNDFCLIIIWILWFSNKYKCNKC